MFDKEYSFLGKHSLRVDALKNVFDQNSKAQLFNRIVDIYVISPLIGFMYNRKAEIDRTKSEGTKSIFKTKIFDSQIISSQEDLKYNYKIIMLLDENYEPSLDKRIDKAFRYFGEDEQDEEYYNSYVLGGVDVLYEKLIENANSETDYINNLYEFLFDFTDKFNKSIKHGDVLKYFE